MTGHERNAGAQRGLSDAGSGGSPYLGLAGSTRPVWGLLDGPRRAGGATLQVSGKASGHPEIGNAARDRTGKDRQS